MIDSENYLLTCMRYIELNPVRARMVSHPSGYPWSSYHHNAQGQTDELITPYLEYRRLGRTDQERQAAYRQLFKHHISERDINEIRKATNKAWALGSTQFKQRIKPQGRGSILEIYRDGDKCYSPAGHRTAC